MVSASVTPLRRHHRRPRRGPGRLRRRHPLVPVAVRPAARPRLRLDGLAACRPAELRRRRVADDRRPAEPPRAALLRGHRPVRRRLHRRLRGPGRRRLGARPPARHPQATLTMAAGAVIVRPRARCCWSGRFPRRFWAGLGAGPSGRWPESWVSGASSVRPSSLGAWAAPVMGMAFAFAWTPCIGPVLGAVLGLADHPLDPGGRGAPPVRLLARAGGALRGHRAGLRPPDRGLRPGPSRPVGRPPGGGRRPGRLRRPAAGRPAGLDLRPVLRPVRTTSGLHRLTSS